MWRQQQNAARLPRGVEAVIGGPLWGLAQFESLAGPHADGLLYVGGAALPTGAADTGLTPEQVSAFMRDYTAANLGAPPGPLAMAGYQAAWLAIWLALEAYGATLDGTPAAAIKHGADGRRVDAPIYLYRWQDGQRALVEQLH